MTLAASDNGRYSLFVMGLALAPAFVWALKYAIPTEDATILFEYSKTLASKGMITYGNADTPIEGATDFLWMLVIAMFAKAGLDGFASTLILNFGGAIALLSLAPSFSKRLIFALGLLCTPYLYSSLDGFSTLVFSAVYCFCIFESFKNTPLFYVALLVLCLIRPDGVAWGSGLIMMRLCDVKDKSDMKANVFSLITWFVIPGAIYFVWRLWYFSEWLPLPFFVKGFGERDWHGSLNFIKMVLIPSLIATMVVDNRTIYLKRLAYFFVIPCLFYGTMRLEQNIGNRFLAPMFFGSMLLLSYDKRVLPLIVFVAASAWWSHKITHYTYRDLLNSSDDSYYSISISRDLASLTGKMVTTEAGRLAYYSNWLVQDSWGLNTPSYAHHLITRQDLKAGAYDLIVMHCYMDLLQSNIPERSYNKTWDNQCRILVSYIQSAQYKVFLMPMMRLSEGKFVPSSVYKSFGNTYNSASCGRYDFYAVSPHYFRSPELIDMLKRHGGREYPLRGVRYVKTREGMDGCFLPPYKWLRN